MRLVFRNISVRIVPFEVIGMYGSLRENEVRKIDGNRPESRFLSHHWQASNTLALFSVLYSCIIYARFKHSDLNLNK